MKRLDEVERRVLSICWLDEYEMRELRVKDLIWKEGWLYAVSPWEDDERRFPDLPSRESHKGHEKYIWMVGESCVPVIAGQEHILLQLTEGHAPDDHVFPEVHMPSHHVLERLKRQYASRLYTMFSGRVPPIDKRRVDKEEAFTIVDGRYDADAVYDVVHVLRDEPHEADHFAIRYIGQRPSRRKNDKDKLVTENILGKEEAEGDVAPHCAVSLPPNLRHIDNNP